MKHLEVFNSQTGEIFLNPVRRTMWNNRIYSPFKKHEDKTPKGENLTQPNMTMPIEKIVKRFASGHPISGLTNPLYEGDTPMLPLNWKTMDLSEKHDYVRDYAAKLREHNQKASEHEKQAHKEAIIADYEKQAVAAKAAAEAAKAASTPATE